MDDEMLDRLCMAVEQHDPILDTIISMSEEADEPGGGTEITLFTVTGLFAGWLTSARQFVEAPSARGVDPDLTKMVAMLLAPTNAEQEMFNLPLPSDLFLHLTRATAHIGGTWMALPSPLRIRRTAVISWTLGRLRQPGL